MTTERLVNIRHPRHDLWMVRGDSGCGWHWTGEQSEALAMTTDDAHFWQTTIYKRTTLITRQIDVVKI